MGVWLNKSAVGSSNATTSSATTSRSSNPSAVIVPEQHEEVREACFVRRFIKQRLKSCPITSRVVAAITPKKPEIKSPLDGVDEEEAASGGANAAASRYDKSIRTGREVQAGSHCETSSSDFDWAATAFGAEEMRPPEPLRSFNGYHRKYDPSHCRMSRWLSVATDVSVGFGTGALVGGGLGLLLGGVTFMPARFHGQRARLVTSTVLQAGGAFGVFMAMRSVMDHVKCGNIGGGGGGNLVAGCDDGSGCTRDEGGGGSSSSSSKCDDQ